MKEQIDSVIGKFVTKEEEDSEQRPILENAKEIEEQARQKTREMEGDVAYDNEWLSHATEPSAKAKAQPKVGTESGTPVETDKAPEDGSPAEDGQPEAEASEESGDEQKDDSGGVKDETAELRKAKTKIEQENALLRDMVNQYREASVKVNELLTFKQEVEPFLPVIQTMKDVRELQQDVQVPEDEMTGVNDNGERFATEADKRRVLANDEKAYAIAMQRGVQRGVQEWFVTRQRQEAICQTLMEEMQKKHNDGKPFDQETYRSIIQYLGESDINRLLDPKTNEGDKRKLLNSATSAVLMEIRRGAGEMTAAEEEAVRKAQEVEAAKAQLLRPKGSLRPKSRTPAQQQQFAAMLEMTQQMNRGRIPLDFKERTHG